MNIQIPFVRGGLTLETRELGEALNADFVDLTADDTAYWCLWRERWRYGETIINVEQDVLPTADLLREMWNCPEDWCQAPIPYHHIVRDAGGNEWVVLDAPFPAFGCVKFSAALLQRHSDVFDHVQLRQPVHWGSLDNRLVRMVLIGELGLRPHDHAPARHLRVEAALGTYVLLDAWRDR